MDSVYPYSTRFPSELKSLLASDVTPAEAKIEDLLKHAPVAEAVRQWFEAHPSAKNQPLLGRVCQLAKTDVVTSHSPQKSPNDVQKALDAWRKDPKDMWTRNDLNLLLASPWRDGGFYGHCMDAEKRVVKAQEIVSTVAEYFETGLLSKTQVFDLLRYHPSGGTLLHFNHGARYLIPKPIEGFTQINNGWYAHETFLHFEWTLKLILPLLEEVNLNNDQLFELLRIQDHAGNTPLHDAKSLKLLLPLMERANLTQEQLLQLFWIANQALQTPLNNTENLQLLLPLIQKAGFNSQQLFGLADLEGWELKAPPYTRVAIDVKASWEYRCISSLGITL